MAMSKANITSFTKSFERMVTTLFTEAPSTLRIPISHRKFYVIHSIPGILSAVALAGMMLQLLIYILISKPVNITMVDW